MKPGERLIDICKRENLCIAFGCENGLCGTCLSHITKGVENLSPPNDEEKEMLELFMASEGDRLVCQCTLIKDRDVEIE